METFPWYWPFVRGIHRPQVNSPHEGQWRGALMVSLIYVWINGWVNNHEAGDLRRHHAHYDVKVMIVPTLEEWHMVKLQSMYNFFNIHSFTKFHKNGLLIKNDNMFCQQTLHAGKIGEWYRTILIWRALCTTCEKSGMWQYFSKSVLISRQSSVCS